MFGTLLMCGALLGANPDRSGLPSPTAAAAADLSAYDSARRLVGATPMRRPAGPSGVSRTASSRSERNIWPWRSCTTHRTRWHVVCWG